MAIIYTMIIVLMIVFMKIILMVTNRRVEKKTTKVWTYAQTGSTLPTL